VTSPYGHVEGYYSNAYGTSSHAEGDHTMATNNSAHSEGISTQALGEASHAEGYYTRANRAYSHVSGMYNTEDNFALLPEWTANTAYVIGNKVRVGTASGYVCITANNDAVFTDSKWQSIQNS